MSLKTRPNHKGLTTFKYITILFFVCLTRTGFAQSSVLQSGTWHKIAVERAGVYRISFDMLRKMGIDPATIDPRRIQMYGRKGGMLPQPNATPRPRDLPQLAIWVAGESDGRFDRSDYILFYGEGPDAFHYNVDKEIFHYENNIYSDLNYYFLTIGNNNGKRIRTLESLEGDHPTINTYNDFSYYEQDRYNFERSGREWFGEQFGAITFYTLTYNLPGIVSGSPVKIVSDVLGQSYSPASFRLYINNALVGEQALTPVVSGRYAIRAIHQRDTFSVSADVVHATTRSAQELKIEFVKGTGFSQGHLDFILLNIERQLALYGDQTVFLSAKSLQHAVSTFQISGAAQARVWDITEHDDVGEQKVIPAGESASFSTETNALRKWIAFTKTPEPVYIGPVANQNIAAAATPNLLIIAHPEFRSEAERLAAHRSTHNGWSVLVVSPEEIYNEFSGGRQDVTALRDYIKLLYDRSPQTLKAVLLFGKSSYDYKDRIINNTNFVPTYQSRNSLDPLRTYSSDDYFAFLDDSEGSWNESPAEHHTLDIGVGRLPVKTAQEARVVVDKIIAYDTNKKSFGSWRKGIVFVADDGNTSDGFTSLHQRQADQMADYIETQDASIDTRRVFMGVYDKIVQPNGETVPRMADDLRRIFDLGALIINFTGHGSEKVWTDERILTEEMVKNLRNNRYPFLVTATCEFGRQDDPLEISSAELSLINSEGGSIGLVTTARPVNAATNFTLNQAFYQALLERDGRNYRTLGEVFRVTKNNSTLGVSNRNFSLIGDPSMVLALPALEIAITDIETSNGTDTLQALSTVTIRGEIQDNAVRDVNFNGILEASLYDRRESFTTTGRNDPPFSFDQWHNAVFRGKAKVSEGVFEISFIMPLNTANDFDFGKLTLYAFDEERAREAKGVDMSFRIGGVDNDAGTDKTPPQLRLFIGDTTFVNGGITTSDTYLVAVLQDESGINISGLQGSHSIQAILDGNETIALNDFYICDVGTYKRGTIRYPLLGLMPGPHTLTLRASDIYNNSAETTIQFVVTDGDELVIETFGNYPNPVKHRTTLFFTHNRSGDDLEAQLFIYNMSGEVIRSGALAVPESEYHINLLELSTLDDTGKKLLPGVYLARLIVRSMTNGSKNEKVTKLIILN